MSYVRVHFRKIKRVQEQYLGSTHSEIHKIPIGTIEVVCEDFLFEYGWVRFINPRDGDMWGMKLDEFDEWEIVERDIQ